MRPMPPVLLIGDVAAPQAAHRLALTRAGFRVRVATSVAQRRLAFAESPPQVVLLDLALPDGSGIDLMQDLLRQRPQTRIIVMSATGSIPQAVEAMRAGAYDFLVRPFDEARLLAAVRSAASPPRRKPARPPDPDPPSPGGCFWDPARRWCGSMPGSGLSRPRWRPSSSLAKAAPARNSAPRRSMTGPPGRQARSSP